MENCRVKAVGSLKDVQQKASKEIQGLTENTFENITSAASETVSNHNVSKTRLDDYFDLELYHQLSKKGHSQLFAWE